MIGTSFTAGFTGIRRRPGLVVLIYAMNLVLALILSIPVYIALGSAVGGTGFDADLAGGFDLILWADIIEEAGEALGALRFQLLWMIPLYLIWKAAASVGLIHALRGDDARSFWQGVGRYTGKAVLLGLLFLVLALIGVVGLLIVAGVLSAFWPGEVGTFWINLVILPTLAISGLAVLDLMHDYARMALVVDEQKVFKAMGAGLAWPFKHGQATWIPQAIRPCCPAAAADGARHERGGGHRRRHLGTLPDAADPHATPCCCDGRLVRQRDGPLRGDPASGDAVDCRRRGRGFGGFRRDAGVGAGRVGVGVISR